MDAVGNKKMLNMLILNVLKKYSDADHRLTQQEIMRILLADYETECDRRSVKNNVLYLKELGYDINMDDGYFLETRNYSNEEIQFLIDSIALNPSKKFSKRRRKALISKLVAEANKYFEPKELDLEEETAEPVETVEAVEEIQVEPEKPQIQLTKVSIEQKIELEPQVEIQAVQEEAEPAPEEIVVEEPVAEETVEKINVRFLAPKAKEEEFKSRFADSYKLMADRKGSVEFLASGTEEEMFSLALIHPELEILSPEDLRNRVSSQLESMNEKYNHKISSFFKKSIW